MNHASRHPVFTRFAWLVLAYNILVIIWGVFLRASHSGDGCGQHWLTCNGEVIPSAPQFKTVIEFSHRITTALAGILVLILVAWAFRQFPKNHSVRKAAFLSLLFIIIEALIGRGLVLTGNTAGNWTPERPYWTIAHLINTFLLLGALTCTAWFASSRRRIGRLHDKRMLILLGLAAVGILIVGISGSLAALSNMFHPATTLGEGLASDFARESPGLVRLRISHPILSILAGIFLVFVSGAARSAANGQFGVTLWSKVVSVLVLVQFASGAATLVLHAPIIMQLIHLFLADAIWIAFIILGLEVLSDVPESQFAGVSSIRKPAESQT